MKNLNSKLILALILSIVLSIPLFTSSLLDFEQENLVTNLKQKELADKLLEQKNKDIIQVKNYLTGHFEPSERKNFRAIPKAYSISGYKMYLRQEVLDAFIKMQAEAAKDGVDLKVASATRNFTYQKNLWNNKWSGVTLVDGKNLAKSIQDEQDRFKKILEYSAVPGTSRHHWGTDIDINDSNPEYFDTPKGIEVYSWLTKNAPLFGFCQPYTKKDNNRMTGYNEEKWHWSYLPIAIELTQEYKKLIKDSDLSGFLGDKYAPNFDLINNYVLSINPECL